MPESDSEPAANLYEIADKMVAYIKDNPDGVFDWANPAITDLSHYLDEYNWGVSERIFHGEFYEFLRGTYATSEGEFEHSSWADIIDMEAPKGSSLDDQVKFFQELWRKFRCPLERLARIGEPKPFWQTDCYVYGCAGCDTCCCPNCDCYPWLCECGGEDG